jgi:hypothetical protein
MGPGTRRGKKPWQPLRDGAFVLIKTRMSADTSTVEPSTGCKK